MEMMLGVERLLVRGVEVDLKEISYFRLVMAFGGSSILLV